MLNLKKVIKTIINDLNVSTPIGEIDMYAGQVAPIGWLLCQGQQVSRTTYVKLFAVIGTTYGSGDGSTTFNVPDMRNRMPIGAGNTYTLNASGGNKDAIIPYHRHSVAAATSGKPSNNTSGAMSANSTHSHTPSDGSHFIAGGTGTGANITTGGGSYVFKDNTSSVSLAHTHSLQDHTHSIGAHNTDYIGTQGNTTDANLPPYRAINFIIFCGNS